MASRGRGRNRIKAAQVPGGRLGSYPGFRGGISLVKSACRENPPAMVKGILGLAVASTRQITNTSLPNGAVGTITTVPLTATGAIPPYTWGASSSQRTLESISRAIPLSSSLWSQQPQASR
jgi:hypothetical protein